MIHIITNIEIQNAKRLGWNRWFIRPQAQYTGKGPVHWEQIASIFCVVIKEYFIQRDSSGGISAFQFHASIWPISKLSRLALNGQLICLFAIPSADLWEILTKWLWICWRWKDFFASAISVLNSLLRVLGGCG